MRPVPRSRAQRKANTLALLRTEVDCWGASADGWGTPISSRSPMTGTARRSCSRRRARLRPRRTSCVPASRASASVRRRRRARRRPCDGRRRRRDRRCAHGARRLRRAHGARRRDHRRVQARSHRSPVEDQRSCDAPSANGRPVSSSVLAFLGTSLAILAAGGGGVTPLSNIPERWRTPAPRSSRLPEQSRCRKCGLTTPPTVRS